jgi:hypothetical protein
MCGGPNPETKMEKMCFCVGESGDFLDNDGELIECTAVEASNILETTPQVAGKIMGYFDDIWTRTVKKGKVVYVPKEEMK